MNNVPEKIYVCLIAPEIKSTVDYAGQAFLSKRIETEVEYIHKDLHKQALQFVEFVLKGLESGHIKSKPYIDYSDMTASELKMQTLHDYARKILEANK